MCSGGQQWWKGVGGDDGGVPSEVTRRLFSQSQTLITLGNSWPLCVHRESQKPTRHTLWRTLEGEGAPPEQEGRAACVRVCVVILRSAQQWLPPKP